LIEQDPQFFGAQSSKKGNWRITHSPILSLDWLHSLLEMDLSEIKEDDDNVLKLSEFSLVLSIESDIGLLVAKFYKKPPFTQMLKQALEQNPARRSWQFAQHLRKLDIATTEPLAYLVERKVGLSHRAWKINRYQDGKTCADYFLHSPNFTAAMRNSTSAIVELLVNLKEHHLCHGELTASNIIITDNDPVLIDLDSMTYHSDKRKVEQHWQRDITRFMNSWKERYDIYKQFRLAFTKHGIET
jgi:hypothetical protein